MLKIAAGATVTVHDLTITKGRKIGGNLFVDGGAGIRNEGALTLRGVAVTDNTASFGGGIYNGGAVTVEVGALVCSNTPANDQCRNVANCPAPANGVCPPEID